MKKLYLIFILMAFVPINISASNIISLRNTNGESFLTLDDETINVTKNDAILKINNLWETSFFPIIDKKTNLSLIPIRIVSEKLGVRVFWEETTKTVTLRKNSTDIVLKIGEKNGTLNGNNFVLQVEPQIINSSSYVPLRFISEVLDYEIKYDTDTIRSYENTPIKKFFPVIEITDKTEFTTSVFKKKVGLKNPSSMIVPFEEINRKPGENFVYTNFPERILSNAFEETYYNQTVSNGDVKVFISQINLSGENIDYIVRLESEDGEDLSLEIVEDFAKLKPGENTSAQVVVPHMERFYAKLNNNQSELHVIKNENTKFKDFYIKDVQDKIFFTAQLSFKTTRPVKITCFAVPSQDSNDYSQIKTPSIFYDYSYEPKGYVPNPDGLKVTDKYYTTYSGYGLNHKLYTEGSITASSLENSAIGFETGATSTNLNEKIGIKEVIEIFLVEARGKNKEIEKAEWLLNLPIVNDENLKNKDTPRSYGNLGNWEVDYNMTTKLFNDTDMPKTFTLNLVPSFQSSMCVIYNNKIHVENQENKKQSINFRRHAVGNIAKITLPADTNAWEILEILVNPGETKDITYNYILGTDSDARVYHIWETK